MTTINLSAENVGRYLESQNVIKHGAKADVESLGGGISNTVLCVRSDDCLVVKQPLANLAVNDDWKADKSRVYNEAAAARAYWRIIDEEGVESVHVPEVIFEDQSNHIIAISCAPESSTPWKQELLDGEVDISVARILGRFLGVSHRVAAANPSLKNDFGHKAVFDQLRIDPYHRTVEAQHPDVAPTIASERERIRSVEKTLVHGDFSPKNILVDRRPDALDLWVIDFEVAHWGAPSFDAAFLLNHLFIKSIYNAEKQGKYLAAARQFWQSYSKQIDWEIESETMMEVAVLMLARVDGKSSVEYVTEDETKDMLRTTAKRVLEGDTESLERFIEIISEVTHRWAQ